MKVLLLLSIFLLALNGFAQDKLEWSATRKLTVADFRGQAPEPLSSQTVAGRTGIETDLSTRESKEIANFNTRISNYFYASESWISLSDPSRLRYIQTMFDLNECMARELRKRYNEERAKVEAGDHEKIYEEVAGASREWEQEYNLATNYGEDLMGQIRWELKISERLQELGEYCKACSPAKR